jgi:hypothetical protein
LRAAGMTTPHTIGGNPLTAAADRGSCRAIRASAGHREITPFVRVQLTLSGVNLAMSKRPRQQKEPLVSTLILEKVTTHGTGLTLEIALAATGIVLGLIATGRPGRASACPHCARQHSGTAGGLR